MTKEELSEYYDRKKKKILGNVNFIGELVLEKFIVLDIVRIIFNSLINKYLEEYNNYQKSEVKPFNKSHEDNLEGLIKFIEIIGKTVEEKEKTKMPDEKKSHEMVTIFEDNLLFAHSELAVDEPLPPLPMDPISLPDLFKILDIILDRSALSPRLASLIKNLNHRRENNWDAPLYKNRGPKKMKEIHDEYQAEQEEIDRRAHDYYQEERESGYKSRKGPKSESQYVVSYEPKKVQYQSEESKNFDTTGIKPKEVEFKPKRGKQQIESKSEEKKMQISHEQLYNDFKEIYSNLSDEENVEEKFIEEVKRLSEHVPEYEIVGGLLSTFYDGKLNDVKKRIPLCNLLLEKGIISPDDFIREFDNTFSKMNGVACDFPQCDEAFATIYLEFLLKYPESFELTSKLTVPDVESEDDDLLDFHIAFVSKLEDLIENERYQSLESSVKNDLSALKTKLKI